MSMCVVGIGLSALMWLPLGACASPSEGQQVAHQLTPVASLASRQLFVPTSSPACTLSVGIGLSAPAALPGLFLHVSSMLHLVHLFHWGGLGV